MCYTKQDNNDNLNKENLTGYPHIDKPWMKYYDQELTKREDPNTNLTEYIKMKNLGKFSNIAETYYGKETSYEEFFDNVDLASKVLSQVGVKKGDIIINMVPNIPEAGQIWLGATQLGAVSDFIDPRPDSMDLMANAKKVLEIIKFEKANYIIALDKCYLAMLKPIEKELIELGINTIITLNASDSMNLLGKIDYLKDVINYNKLRNLRNNDMTIQKLKSSKVLLQKIQAMSKEDKMYKEAVNTSPLNVYKYSDLVRECKNSQFEKIIDEKLINYIGHTSGTSGSRPKPITISNKNSISTLEQLEKGNIYFDEKDKSLRVLPLFAPFGAYDNWLLTLASSANNIDIPEFEINEFGYLLKKHNPNVIMATPAWLAALPDYSYLNKVDLSCIKKIIYGGDSMSPRDEEKLNKWLKEHGSKAEIEKGHGMSEFCGCGSYAQKEYNKPGSIGIPLPNTIYTIVDPSIEDRLVPLKFEEGKDRLCGELIVSSDAVTNGVLHDNIIVPHYEMDGLSYIRTRDLAQMDRDGVFYIDERKDRSFARFDGFKIKPSEIEKIICKNDNVKQAILVDYFDDQRRGIMPMCHLVLNVNEKITDEEKVKIVEDIVYNQIVGNPTTSSRQIPTKFKIRESLPLTKNSKVDFNALRIERLDGTEINVEISETNLTVDNIEIYLNKQGAKVRTKSNK